jgi:hypothetical protein
MEPEELVHGSQDDLVDLLEVECGVDVRRDLPQDANLGRFLLELGTELLARGLFRCHGTF